MMFGMFDRENAGLPAGNRKSLHTPLAATLTLTLALSMMMATLACATDELEIAYESHPEEGVMAAGQPTAEQIPRLATAGYHTILDLRGVEEDRGYDEAAAVQAAGMSYVQVPVASAADLDAATFERFFEVMETAERPLVVHCRSSNRVGALYAAYLAVREGLSLEDALSRGREAGLRSEELTARVRAYVTEQADPPPGGNP